MNPTLLHMCAYCAEVKTLEELATLDVDALPEVFPLSTLRAAVLQLDLQLWLREEGLEDLLPQLVERGLASRHHLLALDPASVSKVREHLIKYAGGCCHGEHDAVYHNMNTTSECVYRIYTSFPNPIPHFPPTPFPPSLLSINTCSWLTSSHL